MYLFSIYFLMFFTYSVLGWLVETLWCSFYQKKVVDRGFLIGPYCPIYGVSALCMIFVLNKYLSDPLALFIIAIVLISFVEYMTSFVMEKLFKARWWDYSDQKFNLNGRICLKNSLCFGIMGLFLMYVFNPFFTNILYKTPYSLLLVMTSFTFTIFSIDYIISMIIIYRLRKHAGNVAKDYTEEISKKVIEKLKNKTIFISRLLEAFPNVKFIPYNNKLKKKTKK